MLPTLICFPRSGSNFFLQQFWRRTGVHLEMTHLAIDVMGSISCIRNPIDTLSSLLTMDYEATRMRFLKRCYDFTLDQFLETRAEKIIFDYIQFYKVLNRSNAVVVDYEVMQKDVDGVVKSICDLFDVKMLETLQDEYKLKDDLVKGYLIRSTHRTIYKQCREIISRLVTDECWELYEEAKKRAIAL